MAGLCALSESVPAAVVEKPKKAAEVERRKSIVGREEEIMSSKKMMIEEEVVKSSKKAVEKQPPIKASSSFVQSATKRKLSESLSEAFSENEPPQQKKKKKKPEELTTTPPRNGLPPKSKQTLLEILASNKGSKIYLFSLPRNVNVKNLVGKNIPLEKPDKIRLGPKEKLKIMPRQNNITSSYQVVLDNMVRATRIVGIIESKKRMKKVDVKALDPQEKNLDIEVTTKQRHPIFASSFTDELPVAEDVVDRLINPQKIKKKKSKQAGEVEVTAAAAAPIVLEEPAKKEKKNKKPDEDTAEEEPKKNKKKLF